MKRAIRIALLFAVSRPPPGQRGRPAERLPGCARERSTDSRGRRASQGEPRGASAGLVQPAAADHGLRFATPRQDTTRLSAIPTDPAGSITVNEPTGANRDSSSRRLRAAEPRTEQWRFDLRQNLFSWANWARLRAANHQVAQAEADYGAAQQDADAARGSARTSACWRRRTRSKPSRPRCEAISSPARSGRTSASRSA